MTDWQPIASAPTMALKQQKVDLWCVRPDGTGYRVCDAFWTGRIWAITTMVGFDIRAFRDGHSATDWMRRPSAPEPLS